MQVNRRKELFPNVTDEQWNDWKWQVKNRIESLEDLNKYINLTAEEQEGVRKSLETLRMAITPYYLSLIDPNDPNDPVRRQAIPTASETHISPADLTDPLHEDEDSPVPGLTHRYPDRVLFLITDMCIFLLSSIKLLYKLLVCLDSFILIFPILFNSSLFKSFISSSSFS